MAQGYTRQVEDPSQTSTDGNETPGTTTYRPLDSNHPSTPNNFASLPHCPQGISRVFVSQLETVGYL